MSKRRILLLCTQPLFGEGLAAILHQESEIDLLGPFALADDSLTRIAEANPDAVLTAEGEKEDQTVSDLITQILQTHPSLPIIRTALRDQQVHLYTSASRPASRRGLIQILRNLPASGQDLPNSSKYNK